jgi:uncharacterized protein
MLAMSNSLKINVILIPEEGQNFVFSEDGAWFKGCFTDSDGSDFILRQVNVSCLITRTSGTVFIKGSFSALIDIDCSRCLERASLPIGGDFTYTLIPAKAETREDLELTPEELEISYYQGDFINLAPIICEQIILQVPMKVLCSEECKGLCPHCGINLNASSCNCHLNFVNDRMAVLKNFRVNN